MYSYFSFWYFNRSIYLYNYLIHALCLDLTAHNTSLVSHGGRENLLENSKLISIWFHMGYFEIISHSLEFLGHIYMKLTRRKHPDHLADSCKHSSVNQMAAGLRLPRSSHGFFLLSPPFQTHFL